MNALMRKEIRLVLWPWIAALFLAVAPAWFYAMRAEQIWSSNITSANNTIIQVALYTFALGCVVLCLATFGQEFSQRTFALTLSQPIDRKQIWRTKTIILASAVLTVTLVLLLSIHELISVYWTTPPSYDPYQHLTPGYKGLIDRAHAFPLSVFGAILIAVTIYSGALWTTLLLRNFFTALALTILVPLSLLLCFAHFVGNNDSAAKIGTPILLGTYSVIGFIFARRLFLRAQDVIWTGGDIALPRSTATRWGLLTSFQRTTPYIALVKKELQLQQVAFIVAAILFVCHVATLPLRRFIDQHPSNPVVYVVVYVFVVWMALPLLIGSAAVADERRLGTHEMLLTQPISRAIQLFIKLAVTLLLSILLAAIVPYVLEQLAFAFGAPQPMITRDSFRTLLGMSSLIAGIAFFNSTQARSSLEAFCLSMVTVWPIAGAVALFESGNSETGEGPTYGLLTPYFCAVFIVPTAISLLWKNYQRTRVRWTTVVGTWIVLGLSVTAAWATASFTWYRGWEFFMRLEPKHGVAVMSVNDRAKLGSIGNGAIALLPDGRLWMCEYKFDVIYDKPHRDHVTGIAPKNAHFLPGTWLDITTAEECYAIKSDHTLWRLRPNHQETNSNGRTVWKKDPPYQVGTDADWASLTSGGNFTLGIKQDGSLWGWGGTSSGALGPEPAKEVTIPKNVWPGTHWSRVLASGAFCIGIKTDGTSWQWGSNDSYAPEAERGLHPSEFIGSNWIAFSATLPIEVALRDDHTLWSAIPKRWVGHFGPHWTIFGFPVDLRPGVHQLGNGSDWRQLSDDLAALKTDGTWVVNNGEGIGRPNGRGVKVSDYTDWITVYSRSITLSGLAADGTMSAWMRTDAYPYYTCRSRRPTWSTNILQTANR